MTKIEAYIKPHKLTDVTMALQQIPGLRGMSFSDVKGFGWRESKEMVHPMCDDLLDFAPYTKIEIFCYDDLADTLVSIIDEAAQTGLRGDGKIYVSDVGKSYKIGRGVINDQ